uniref:Uncharacterized protein n=1 Tax=Rhizophora mucronata TaxID=61149 RepID=A0A2P2K6U5_RHIMU
MMVRHLSITGVTNFCSWLITNLTNIQTTKLIFSPSH